MRAALTADEARAELERQSAEVADLVATHADALAERPPSGRWSVAEHLQHLALMNGPYLRTMKEAVRELDPDEMAASRPARPWLGRVMIWSQEPPPRFRMRTLRQAIPHEDGPDLATAERDFSRAQDAFRGLLAELDGVDGRRIRIRSPFATWMSMTLDQGIRLLLAHNRRHLWLSREALRDAGLREEI